MDLKSLTDSPDLGQYKKQAKELLQAWRSGRPEALARGTQRHPHFAERRAQTLGLSDAQLVLAREHGFESWPRFASHVAELKKRSGAEYVFEVAADAVTNGEVEELRRLLADEPNLARMCSSRTHQATLLHYVAANGVENYRQRSPTISPKSCSMQVRGSTFPCTFRRTSPRWTKSFGAMELAASPSPPRSGQNRSAVKPSSALKVIGWTQGPASPVSRGSR